jgi:ABC-type Mn2+/Zn2+ transport system permease subunit
VSAASGLILSYYLDTASGPTIVMVAVCVFIASFAARAIRR